MDFQARIENLFNTRIAELVYMQIVKILVVMNHQWKSRWNQSPNDETNEDNSKEVFHIAENKFTYEEAREMCNQYNSDWQRMMKLKMLTTMEQIGVIMVGPRIKWLFSHTKKVYNDLKKYQVTEWLWSPGVNGGYFENPNIKLVNVTAWSQTRKKSMTIYARNKSFTCVKWWRTQEANNKTTHTKIIYCLF